MPIFVATSTNTFAKNTIKHGRFPVPFNVKLFLRPYEDGTYLVRLHNFDTQNEVNVPIDETWKLTEYTLAANQLNADWKKNQYQWKEDTTGHRAIPTFSFMRQLKKAFEELNKYFTTSQRVQAQSAHPLANTIVLKPFEIKTFKMVKA